MHHHRLLALQNQGPQVGVSRLVVEQVQGHAPTVADDEELREADDGGWHRRVVPHGGSGSVVHLLHEGDVLHRRDEARDAAPEQVGRVRTVACEGPGDVEMVAPQLGAPP